MTDAAPTDAAPIDVAIVLAAGEGSRLRAAAPSKPLCPVGGKPLVDHALERLAAAGIARAVVVTGYRGEALAAHLASRAWPLAVESAAVADWTLPNGVSALAGGRAVDPALLTPALLVMCDHLVEPALYRVIARAGTGPGLRLGVDRRLDDEAVDLDDVTRVATDGQGGGGQSGGGQSGGGEGGGGRGGGGAASRIVAIGKGLATFDAFDTGVFAVGPAFFAALAALDRPSITQGVQALAGAGRALAHDVGALAWIDVDDPAALAMAERRLGLATLDVKALGGGVRPVDPARRPTLPLARTR